MAAALVGGAAIGAVFGELLRAVLEIKDKAIMFKQSLIYLRSTLVAIAPVVKEIEQQNNDLGRPKEELESLIREMEEGTKLVCKCSKIHRLNYIARVRYQEQLVALVDSLVKFFIIDMQAQTARDQKETLLKVRRILSAVNKFPLVNRNDTTASSSDSATMPVDVSESVIHDSSATQPDENAMETNSVEEAMEQINQVTRSSSSDADTVTIVLDVSESGSTATQQAEDNTAEQVMEPITGTKQEAGQSKDIAGNDQGMKHLVNEKSYDQLGSRRSTEKKFLGIRIPKIPGGFNRQVKKATSIEQDNKLDTGDLKTSYNKQVPPKKLVFLDSSYNFDLEDLLRASAEVLGKGSYGTTYKAILEDGSATVAVKRLKEVKISKTEFEKQVEMLQTLLPPHPNVCPLRAYYSSIDEKLLIYDYIAGDSLSALMHGRWKVATQLSRMKILLGAARGIAHIHSISGMNFVHGNIKSSNVLVTADFQGCISDFGLTRLMGFSVMPSENKGYQAPEVDRIEKLTQKSDVYSFGILLLEVLTGITIAEDPDLPSWVELQVRDGLSYSLLDNAILKDDMEVGDIALDMMSLARACASVAPDMRPSMDEVMRKMEGLITSD